MISPSPSEDERLAEIEAHLGACEKRVLGYSEQRAEEDVRYLLDRVKAAEAALAVAQHNQDTFAAVLDADGQLDRLTAAGLAAEAKWADEVEKRREQEEVIQALREALVVVLAMSRATYIDPFKIENTIVPALAIGVSSATDGEHDG